MSFIENSLILKYMYIAHVGIHFLKTEEMTVLREKFNGQKVGWICKWF